MLHRCDMYVRVSLEGFCARLPATLGLEDDFIDAAGWTGIGAALASKSWLTFGGVDCRLIGAGWIGGGGLGAMARA